MCAEEQCRRFPKGWGFKNILIKTSNVSVRRDQGLGRKEEGSPEDGQGFRLGRTRSPADRGSLLLPRPTHHSPSFPTLSDFPRGPLALLRSKYSTALRTEAVRWSLVSSPGAAFLGQRPTVTVWGRSGGEAAPAPRVPGARPGARVPAMSAAPQTHLKGSDSCTSRAAPRILPSLRAWAKAFSSTSPPRAAFTRNAPCLICGRKKSRQMLLHWTAPATDRGVRPVRLLTTCVCGRSGGGWWQRQLVAAGSVSADPERGP